MEINQTSYNFYLTELYKVLSDLRRNGWANALPQLVARPEDIAPESVFYNLSRSPEPYRSFIFETLALQFPFQGLEDQDVDVLRHMRLSLKKIPADSAFFDESTYYGARMTPELIQDSLESVLFRLDRRTEQLNSLVALDFELRARVPGVSKDLLHVIWAALRAAFQGYAPQMAVEFARWVIPVEHRCSFATLAAGIQGHYSQAQIKDEAGQTATVPAPVDIKQSTFLVCLRTLHTINTHLRRQGLRSIEAMLESPSEPGSLFQPISNAGGYRDLIVDVYRAMFSGNLNEGEIAYIAQERIDVECRNPGVSRELMQVIMTVIRASMMGFAPSTATELGRWMLPLEHRITHDELQTVLTATDEPQSFEVSRDVPPASKELFIAFMQSHLLVIPAVAEQGVEALEASLDEPRSAGSVFKSLATYGVYFDFLVDVWRVAVLKGTSTYELDAFIPKRIELECQDPEVSRELLQVIWDLIRAHLEGVALTASLLHARRLIPVHLRPSMHEIASTAAWVSNIRLLPPPEDPFCGGLQEWLDLEGKGEGSTPA